MDTSTESLLSENERLRSFVGMISEGAYLGFHLKRPIFIKERTELCEKAAALLSRE